MSSQTFQDFDIVRLRVDLPEPPVASDRQGAIIETIREPDVCYRVAFSNGEGNPPTVVDLRADQMELVRSANEMAQERFDMAAQLNRAGQYEDSLREIELYLRYRPADDLGWVNRGINLGALERFDEALTSLDEALKLNPEQTTAVRLKAQFLQFLGRSAEAVAVCDAALKVDYSSAESWNELGVALSMVDRDDEAVACFDRTLQKDSYLADACYNRSLSLERLGRLGEALDSSLQSNELAPGDPQFFTRSGDLLLRLDHPDEALAHYNHALKLDVNFFPALQSRGIAHTRAGRHEEAVRDYESAFAITSDPRSVVPEHGESLLHVKRYKDAIFTVTWCLLSKQDEEKGWDRLIRAFDGYHATHDAGDCASVRSRLPKEVGEHPRLASRFRPAVQVQPGEAGAMAEPCSAWMTAGEAAAKAAGD